MAFLDVVQFRPELASSGSSGFAAGSLPETFGRLPGKRPPSSAARTEVGRAQPAPRLSTFLLQRSAPWLGHSDQQPRLAMFQPIGLRLLAIKTWLLEGNEDGLAVFICLP